jgi:hypothetical protein
MHLPVRYWLVAVQPACYRLRIMRTDDHWHPSLGCTGGTKSTISWTTIAAWNSGRGRSCVWEPTNMDQARHVYEPTTTWHLQNKKAQDFYSNSCWNSTVGSSLPKKKNVHAIRRGPDEQNLQTGVVKSRQINPRWFTGADDWSNAEEGAIWVRYGSRSDHVTWLSGAWRWFWLRSFVTAWATSTAGWLAVPVSGSSHRQAPVCRAPPTEGGSSTSAYISTTNRRPYRGRPRPCRPAVAGRTPPAPPSFHRRHGLPDVRTLTCFFFRCILISQRYQIHLSTATAQYPNDRTDVHNQRKLRNKSLTTTS